MEAKATLKYARISPRKVKIVLDLIRGKDAGTAMANAENNFQMDPDKLYVTECYVCPGPTLKRIMPRAKGSADRILKRTSHVTIVVQERDSKKEEELNGSEGKSPRFARGRN